MVRQQPSTPPRSSQPGSSPGRRIPLVLQLLGAVLVVTSVVVGVFSSHASATPLTNGTVTLKLTPSGAVATAPLASHQVVDLSVAPNSTLNRSALEAAGFPSGIVAIKVLECADLNGQAANLPKSPRDCEPATIASSADLLANGSFALQGYTIYSLPDAAELGSPNGTVCASAPHQCVLGFFSNQNDFSQPHLFSAPFEVVSTAPSSSTGSSGSAGSGSGATSGGGAAGVSIPPATLANTGAPTLWPWLLGVGSVLLVVGSALRCLRRRPGFEGRR